MQKHRKQKVKYLLWLLTLACPPLRRNDCGNWVSMRWIFLKTLIQMHFS